MLANIAIGREVSKYYLADRFFLDLLHTGLPNLHRSAMSPHMHITDQSLHAATKGATVDEILVDSDASAESTPAPISQTTGQTTPAEIETLPYWLVNVPQEQWPAECPEWLRNLEPRAIEVLSTLDGAYKKHDWEMVKETISEPHTLPRCLQLVLLVIS
jgi:hypothetical protein